MSEIHEDENRLGDDETPVARTNRETCKKCNGLGRFIGYSGRALGECFACKGRGFKEYKQAPEARAKVRGQRAARKAKSAEESKQYFAQAYPPVWAWILESRERFPFAQAMYEAIERFGDLTENQLAACERSIAKRDLARATAKAAQAAKSADVDASKLLAAFDAASGSGLRLPIMRFEGFKASLSSKYAGVIYLKGDGGEYLGKIAGGKFQASRECTGEASEAVQAAMADPMAAAVAYGRRTGRCSCCGLGLTNKLSVELGIGPVCRSKFGL